MGILGARRRWVVANPRRLLLLDGLAALLGAVMLGVVLPRFADAVGLPPSTLRALSLVSVACCVYSLGSFARVRRHWERWLAVIACVNVCYACAMAVFLLMATGGIKRLGFAYFGLELAVLVALSLVELSAVLHGAKRLG